MPPCVDVSASPKDPEEGEVGREGGREGVGGRKVKERGR